MSAANTHANAVELKGVTFQRGERSIFKDVDIAIPRGKVTAIMGPSGCGKTTLLRLIAAQLMPASGEVWVGGQNLPSLSRSELFDMRKQMGVLFQSGALFTDLDVFENVAFPLRVHTQLSDEMIRDIDYENWIRQQTASDKAAEFRISNVWFLVEALKNTLEKDEEGDMTIEDAIGKLVLRDMLERQQEEEENAEGVQMMTLHASKGLEFPYVFIMGVEEEILPHRSSIEADTIEEERRLAYVGITRARQNLAMTFAAKRKQYGEIIECMPSRFLDELPQEDLEWEGQEDAPVEVKAARGNDALAAMRAMLKR